MRKVQTKKRKKVTKKINKEATPEFISVVILCDQYGPRMKTYGPCSLIQIKNAKVLDYQIKYILETFQKCEIVLCTGFNADKIQKYIYQKYANINIRVVENQNFEWTNTCESVRLCLNNVNNSKILIIDGSILFFKETIAQIDIHKSCVIYENNNPTLEIGLNCDKDKLEYMSVGLNKKWSEILFLHDRHIIAGFINILSDNSFKKRFIFEAINKLLDLKYDMKCIESKKQNIKIENTKTFQNLRSIK